MRYCSDACRRRKITDADAALEAALRAALPRRGATVDPSEIAAARGDDLDEPARRAARRLVAAGGFEILVNGRVADPSTARGPILLRRSQ